MAKRRRPVSKGVIHGRLDLSGPLVTAWEVAQACPGAELMIFEDFGDTGSPAMPSRPDGIAKFDPVLFPF